MLIELKTKDGRTFKLDLQCAVIKIGSAVITRELGRLDEALIDAYANVISRLVKQGIRIVIVSSGAVSAGIGEIGSRQLPQSIPEKQALAAIGQSKLMKAYAEAFAKYGRKVAQILLTRGDMEDRRRYLNARYTLDMLYKMGVVPVINENDTTTIDELRFGDNDLLSAIVATKLGAQLLVILTNVAGLYDGDPQHSSGAKLIPVVERVTPAIKSLASTGKSVYGSGGMTSKLQAAEYCALAGIYTIMVYGKNPAVLDRVFAGEVDGTLFLPTMHKRLSSRERWIAFGKTGRGRKVIIDAGASEALLKKGKSLLAVGIKSVEGEFRSGDVVEIYDEQQRLLGKGLINYSSEELQKIKGKHTREIRKILGYMDYDEVVHRDNFVQLIDTP